MNDAAVSFLFSWLFCTQHVNDLLGKLPSKAALCFGLMSICHVCLAEPRDLEILQGNKLVFEWPVISDLPQAKAERTFVEVLAGGFGV